METINFERGGVVPNRKYNKTVRFSVSYQGSLYSNLYHVILSSKTLNLVHRMLKREKNQNKNIINVTKSRNRRMKMPIKMSLMQIH